MNPALKHALFLSILAIAGVVVYRASCDGLTDNERLHLAALLCQLAARIVALYAIVIALWRNGLLAYPALLMGGLLLSGVLPWLGTLYAQSHTPSQPLSVVGANLSGANLLGYRIGSTFNVPQCAIKTSIEGPEYVTGSVQNCFRHIDSADADKPAKDDETLLVDQLDIGQHYAHINWIRPVCVGVERGTIWAVAVHLGAPEDKAAPLMESTLSRALHAEPKLGEWSNVDRYAQYRYNSRVWKRPDAVYAIFTEHWYRGKVGGAYSMMIVAKPDTLQRLKGRRTEFGGDCPALGDAMLHAGL